MDEFIHSLHSFITSLRGNHNVFLNPQGKWRKENKTVARFKSFFREEDKVKLNLVKAFIKVLDQIESVPIHFSYSSGVTASQPMDFHGYAAAAQAVLLHARACKSRRLLPLLYELKEKTLALLYRLEAENGGLRLLEINRDVTFKILTLAKAWKKEEKIFWKSELTQPEIDSLEEVCRYSEFAKCLLEDTALRQDLFLWIIRDGLPGPIFIQYPALRGRLTLYNLRGRLGRMGKDFLLMKKIDAQSFTSQLKMVVIPFEGQQISLLDIHQEILFRGNYKVKLQEVLCVFRDKPRDLGNFEMFAQGVTNWNSNCMGWWNHDLKAYELVDLEIRRWWEQLPILEVLTVEEASRRFLIDLDGHRWALAAKSAREYTTLDYERSHAYMEMAIPTSDHLYYIIYTFGKAVLQLPKSTWQWFYLLGAHIPATIVYPDETMFFTHRQQLGYSFVLTEEEGIRLMNAFKEDILTARTGNMVFQIEAENCGKWIQNHLEENLGSTRVPNLYRFPLLEAEPNGFMAKFFSFFKNLPQFCRNRMFILIHYPLGAWRGRWVVDKKGQKIWKSLTNSAFWQDAVTYLPAFLHKQHEIGIFADDPDKHKIWIESTPHPYEKTEKPAQSSHPLFEEPL